MRFIKNYTEFLGLNLNEAFDLTSYVQKEKIPDNLVDISTEIINGWYVEAGNNTPGDVRGKKDNLILWYARNIKKICIAALEPSHPVNSSLINMLKTKLERDVISDESLLNIKNSIINGKETGVLDYICEFIISKMNVTKITSMKDYIFSMNRNKQFFKINFMSTFEEMAEKSEEWHKSLKASGTVEGEDGYVLKKYDDGYYWVDLLTNDSREEAQAMGHCGRTSHDTIVSLRKVNINGVIEPFVTLALDYAEDLDVDQTISDGDMLEYSIMYQCKGRGNKKPVEKYHRYIIDFLLDDTFNIEEIGEEYSTKDDFQLSDIKDLSVIDEFLNKKPDMFFADGVELINFVDNKQLVEKLYELTQTNDSFEFNIKSFTNMYTLCMFGIISIDEFKERYTNIDSMKNGVIYMKTGASNLASFSCLYSDERTDSGSSYSEIVEHIDGDNDYFEGYGGYNTFDVLKYHNINDENLLKIFNYVKDEYLEDDCTFKDFKDEYKRIIGHGAAFDETIVDAIENAYGSAQYTADENEKWNSIYKPLKEFCGYEKIELETMPLKNEYIKKLTHEDASEVHSSTNAIDLYENIFVVMDIETDISEKFKYSYPYHGNWIGDVKDDDFNEELTNKLLDI